MEYTCSNGYIVVTCDLDFSAILAATHEMKPSVVQIRDSVIHAEHAAELISFAMHRNSDNLRKGAILSIDARNIRTRLLPI